MVSIIMDITRQMGIVTMSYEVEIVEMPCLSDAHNMLEKKTIVVEHYRKSAMLRAIKTMRITC